MNEVTKTRAKKILLVTIWIQLNPVARFPVSRFPSSSFFSAREQ